MKLISCHIEGFGNIINKDLSFNENVNEILEKNGFGKSTISAFIKAMFYGLVTVKKSTKDFLDRMHYFPFSSSKFGGNIVFENEGYNYKIERFFDVKSDTKDTLKVFKNGTETEELGSNIGAKLFGFDVDAFNRILFINSEMITLSTTTDINKKLNNDLNQVPEDFDLDKVIDKLEAKIIKKNKIMELKDNRKQLQAEIQDRNKIEKSLKEKYQQYNELEKKLKDMRKELREADNKNSLLEKWKILDEKNATKKDLLAKANAVLAKYDHGLPSDEELNELDKTMNEMVHIKARLEANKLTDSEEIRFHALKEQFQDSIPDEKDLIEISDTLNELSKNVASQEILSKKKYDSIIERFQNSSIDEKTIEDLNALINQYVEHKKIYDEMPEKKLSNVTKISKNPSNGKLYFFLCLSCVLFLIMGIGLLFVNTIAGGIITSISGIGLLVDGFFYLRSLSLSNHSASMVVEEINQEKADYYKNVIVTDTAKINSIITKWAYFDEDPRHGASCFIEGYNKFKSEMKQKLADEQEKTSIGNKIAIEKTLISDFFNKYKIIANDYTASLVLLRADIMEFENLKNKVFTFQKINCILNQDLSQAQQLIADFKAKFALNPSFELTKNIRIDSHDLVTCTERLDKLQIEISEYSTDNNLKERPLDDVSIDTDYLAKQIKLRDEEFAQLKVKIEDDENNVASREDFENRLKECEDNLAAITYKNELLSQTILSLKQALQNQKDRYAKPVKDCFMEYSQIIRSIIGERIMMDKDYLMTYEQNGEQRPIDHLSKGEASICALCFRLALLDNMYEDNQPFIIMDDPFVNLDESYMQKVNMLILEQSKKRQIIYFTCHESRLIKK